MNSHTTWGVTGARATSPFVSLIVSTDWNDHYLVDVNSDTPRCPRIAWPSDLGMIDGLGAQIENAVQAELGLQTEFIDVLSFLAPDLYVLIAVRESVKAPGTAALTLAELARHDAEPVFLKQVQAAEDRIFAERFAATISNRIESALQRSVACIEGAFAMEEGRVGWSQDLKRDMVGVVSSAQGILTLIHADARSPLIEPAARCLEEAQNSDGGWRIQHSLVGWPDDISITESTCYCLWALVEANRSVDTEVINSGIAWLLHTQRPSGGWPSSANADESQVIPTAFAVRILARLGFTAAADRGAGWLVSRQSHRGGWAVERTVEREDEPLVASTAHAVISLLSAGMSPVDEAVGRGCAFLRSSFNSADDGVPWSSTTSSTEVAERTSMSFGHYATPWALVALLQAGADLGDPLVQRGLSRLLDRQQSTGAWSDPAFANHLRLWSIHDAVFCLRTVREVAARNLAPVSLRRHITHTSRTLELLIQDLVTEQQPSRRRRPLWRG